LRIFKAHFVTLSEGKGLEAVAKPFFVILNEVKDLELVENNRFFATLRMTNH
jgi:hypothetical protein